MKLARDIPIFILTLFLTASILTAQADKERILALRTASNQALKAYDTEKVLSFLTADALTTTGNGTLLTSKNALKNYILEAASSKMYWLRTTTDILINDKKGLAWEHGSWKGYDPDQGSEHLVGGNYAAMWTKASGEWKIKSQLFVTLKVN